MGMSARDSAALFQDKVASLGQVFTPPAVVDAMLRLRKNKGSVLEPSCGDGAFLSRIKGAVGIEIDEAIPLLDGMSHGDFFSYSTTNKFDTIIGNPPYVRYQDIPEDTKSLLPDNNFDKRSNLYLFFIYKAMQHLDSGGELIFITPRDFIKATSARNLNTLLYKTGSITDYQELGDAPVFKGYSPNCSIWRWQKGRRSKVMSDGRNFCHRDGVLWFGSSSRSGAVGDCFDVKVGAVSGADSVFTNDRVGCTDFVCSKTAATGETRKMIYNRHDPVLDRYKDVLLKRRIRRFDETNWWEWGRAYHEARGERIYVNCKTRNPRPFFASREEAYDGSVLALFPREGLSRGVSESVDILNSVNWDKLGFVCDGRLQFTQRSLERAPVDLAS